MSFLKKHSIAVAASAGVAGAFAVCMAFLFLAALLTYREVFTGDMRNLTAYLGSGLGVFCCTVLTAKLRGRQSLPLGLSIGVCFLLVCLMINLGIGGAGTDWSWLLKQGAVCIGCGLLGAFVCAGKSSRPRRRRKGR